MFYIGANTSYETIHLKIWHMYRIQIAKFVNENDEVKFKVNLEQDSMEYLLDEYKRFLQFSSTNSLQYELKLEEQFVLDFDREKSLLSEFDQISKQNKQIEIKLNMHTQLSEIPQINTYTEKEKPKHEYNLYDCLDLFIQKEVLDKGNEWYCNACKQHKQATKRMEIFETPKILIIHIKRFRTNRVSSIGNFYFQSGGQKLDDYINFPINGLNMSKYVLSHQYKQSNEPLLYDLFAVSNHYGSMSGGHYTAYAKNPIYNRWFDFNDSSVSESSVKDVVSRAAYVLFYKRREKATNHLY